MRPRIKKAVAIPVYTTREFIKDPQTLEDRMNNVIITLSHYKSRESKEEAKKSKKAYFRVNSNSPWRECKGPMSMYQGFEIKYK